jgi:tripartite ATP-independent transporter DctP family solute receptor
MIKKFSFPLVLAMLVISCSKSMDDLNPSAVEYEIALAHVTSDKEPINQAMEVFAENVARRSGSRMSITVFANGILGNNPELYEQVRAGAPIITISDPGYLSDFVPDFGVLGGPYLMEDAADFQKIIDSQLYDDMKQRLRDEAGIELLALNWLFGSRHMIADRPISRPADIAGMTFRTPPNIMWVETFDAMGARPTQLAFAEVYSGLSAGVVDGAESPLPTLFSAKLYEVKKHLSLTGHFKGFTGLVIGIDFFDSLPPDLREILSEEAVAAGVFMTELIQSSEDEWIAKFEAEGVEVNREIDTEAFRQATAEVYDRFPQWSDGLYARVRQILDD